MNERIKELAKEAGYYLYDLTETHGIKTVETDSTDEWITLEKFAELIVRECADFIAPMGDYSGGHGEPSVPRPRDCAKRLKEHFGVEE
ncbi:hypothetical protein UFOVP58_189 [uncultured Caudovirales phage]|uniref:Uncharacterized protein n=1 Tax=uncultured Caudovirales phage TaxID=2100421 RepID=A0A6J5KZW2_9CAUD|nr:hypothetical protein UFOVP58_189 [uncultured Caudovirales phage]